jgi:hypothetical protein
MSENNPEGIRQGDCVLLKEKQKFGLVFRVYNKTLIVDALDGDCQHYKYEKVELVARAPRKGIPSEGQIQKDGNGD